MADKRRVPDIRRSVSPAQRESRAIRRPPVRKAIRWRSFGAALSVRRHTAMRWAGKPRGNLRARDRRRTKHDPNASATEPRVLLLHTPVRDILTGVWILLSVLKHGVTEAEIRSALEVPMREVRQGEDLLLIIGADSAARLLEVVVADPGTDDERVIHAMPLRPKFYRYL